MNLYPGKIAIVACACLLATAVMSQAGGHSQKGEAYHGMHDMKGHGQMHAKRGGLAGLSGMLDAYDADNDGNLTQEEILSARAAQLKQFDTDGDGSLTIDEYESLWLDAMRERMVDRFQQHDDDGDGLVTVDEFNEEFERIVQRRDRNGDGVLNAED